MDLEIPVPVQIKNSLRAALVDGLDFRKQGQDDLLAQSGLSPAVVQAIMSGDSAGYTSDDVLVGLFSMGFNRPSFLNNHFGHVAISLNFYIGVYRD